MNILTSNARFRQRVVKKSYKIGVTADSKYYRVSRQAIYEWQHKYDGKSWKSLLNRKHRPHHHPNEHTPEELKLIADMRKHNLNAGLVVFWVKLRQRGYTRSVTGLYRVLRKQGQMTVKPPNPKYIAKPYEQMLYPGQRVQIDVKVVPAACIVGDAQAKGEKYYQYTAIDEYSHFRYLKVFKVHNYKYNRFPMRPLNWKAHSVTHH